MHHLRFVLMATLIFSAGGMTNAQTDSLVDVFPQSSFAAGSSFAIVIAARLKDDTGATLFTNGAGSVTARPWHAADANLLKSPLTMAGVGTIAFVADADRRSSVV